MFDVTLSLHGHAEDHLFIHSLRSAEATCEAANRNGIRAELLIVLDAPTPKTKAVASSSTYTASRIKIVENKDLGLSRNDAVREANAPFIAFLDGDDLVSENWLLESYRYYETLTDRRTILHTEVMVGIHDENWVRFQIESDQTEFTAFELSQNWYFCNNSFAPRDIYLSLPFQRSRRNESLGAEDWKWSADSITRGFVHHYVPRTAYYYRRQHQRLSLGHTGGMQVMPSGLFNVQNIALWGQENYFKTLAKYVPEYVPATPGMPLAQQAARLYDSLTTAPSNEVLGPLPSSERHQVYRFPRVDDWLLED